MQRSTGRTTPKIALSDLPPCCADVIRNPQDFAHLPCVLQDAWMAAKEAQGNPITSDQLQHLPLAVPIWSGDRQTPVAHRENSVAAMIATVQRRTRIRIRNHATAQGYTLVTPTPGGRGMINHHPTHFENLNRAQLRRDRLRDLGERALRMLTWATVIAGGAYVASLFAEMINLLNRSW